MVGVTAQVVAAGDAAAALAAEAASKREQTLDEQPEDRAVKECVDGEAGPD